MATPVEDSSHGKATIGMDMERTNSEVFPGRIYIGGPSANPYWSIPLALKSLCGEIEGARILIQAHEPLLNHRLEGFKETLTELGIATICIVTTGLIAERAIKTLIAQTKPLEKPWSRKDAIGGHNLSGLFGKRLNADDQAAVQHQLETLPSFWKHYADTSSVDEILKIASDNFVDWRYAMEPKGVTGGVPKPLLKVAVAITLVSIHRLTQWQADNQLAAPPGQ